MNVVRVIAGHKVIATAVFKGAPRPAYWQVSVNDRVLPKTFSSTLGAFHFVSSTGPQNLAVWPVGH